MAQKRLKEAGQNKDTAALRRLYNWNRWLALLHAAQGVAVLVLSAPRTWQITTNYLTTDPLASTTAGHPVLAAATRQLFSINLGYLVAAFFFMSAFAHLAAATFYRNRYETDIQQGVNRLRWLEYGISASTMLVAIGLLSGIYDLSSLCMIFALTLVMNLLGLAMELYNKGKARPHWLAYWIGALAGFVPWVVIGFYLFGANAYGSGHIPGFVYGIYASIFIFFNCFAINMYLQYQRYGKWSNYLYGEKVYMILSLAAKTALAWQVFAGALRP